MDWEKVCLSGSLGGGVETRGNTSEPHENENTDANDQSNDRRRSLGVHPVPLITAWVSSTT